MVNGFKDSNSNVECNEAMNYNEKNRLIWSGSFENILHLCFCFNVFFFRSFLLFLISVLDPYSLPQKRTKRMRSLEISRKCGCLRLGSSENKRRSRTRIYIWMIVFERSKDCFFDNAYFSCRSTPPSCATHTIEFFVYTLRAFRDISF